MRRAKEFLSFVLACVLAVAIVPGGAWADAVDGTLGTHTGTITVSNAKQGETYTLYRLFELAKFVDEKTAADEHDQETYEYVIDSTSTWYTFLTTYGANGAGSSVKYAYVRTGTATEQPGQLFWISNTTQTLNGTTYHTISATSAFKNAGSTSFDDTSAATSRTDSEGTAVGADYASVDTANKVAQDFAQEALKYAKANNVEKIAEKIAEKTESASGTLTLTTTAALGYYLVGSSMGTLASLDTTNRDVTIYEKNDEPTITKSVLKKGETIPAASAVTAAWLEGTGWTENTDADLLDHILFRTTITAQQGVRDYRLHDVMEAGLVFQNARINEPSGEYTYSPVTNGTYDYTTKVYLVRGSSDEAVAYFVPQTHTLGETTYTNYTLLTTLTDTCDFEIHFQDALATDDLVTFIAKPVSAEDTAYDQIDIKDGDRIVVTYWAQLTDAAEVWGTDKQTASASATVKTNDGTGDINSQETEIYTDDRNANYTVLTYGNASHTIWAKSTVTTYGFEIVKTELDTSDDEFHLLAGAKFSLYKATDGTTTTENPITFAKKDGETTTTYSQTGSKLYFTKDATTNSYVFAGDGVTTGTAEISSAADKAIFIEGLEEGYYLLVEDAAPTGYNKLTDPILIYVNGDTDYDGAGTFSSPEDQEGLVTVTTLHDNGDTYRQATVRHDATVTSKTVSGKTVYEYVEANNGGVHIVNQAGTELPSTGGIGTKAFYVVGGILVVGSVVLLITKKRMSSKS